MSYADTTQPSDVQGFAAIADPTRRRIIALLAERDRTVKEISAQFEVSRPAISKHLRILRQAGLVTETKKGRERFQHFEGSALQPVADWVKRYEAFWSDRLANLKSIVEDES